MSVEFIEDNGGTEFTDLLATLMGPAPVPYSPDGVPLPIQHSEAMELIADHENRKGEAEADTESGMLTPRITVREHGDIHVLLNALDEFMTKRVHEWENAVAAYGVGGNEFSLEDLTLHSREITEVAKLRYALDRAHVAWAETQEEQG